ncbi:MAG: HEAT repeat domain-containing protein, partial [Candidatus Omnitrophica bacterium]|nr:HEAT repeat domain-containing protein [Candidatus Omnitrophota bacterium]
MDALIKGLGSNNILPDVRGQCVMSLGIMGDPRAVDALISIISDKTSIGGGISNLGKSAIIALGMIGDRRAIEPIRKVFPDIGSRREAAVALQKMGWSPANIDEEMLLCTVVEDGIAHLIQRRDAVVPSLSKLLGNKDAHSWDRIFAIKVLKEIKNPDSVELFIEILEDKTEDWAVQCEAIRALDKTSDPRIMDFLIKGLCDDVCVDKRLFVARALLDINDSRLAPIYGYLNSAACPLTEDQAQLIIDCMRGGKKFYAKYTPEVSHDEIMEYGPQGIDPGWTETRTAIDVPA